MDKPTPPNWLIRLLAISPIILAACVPVQIQYNNQAPGAAELTEPQTAQDPDTPDWSTGLERCPVSTGHITPPTPTNHKTIYQGGQ
jgi:hypothetical protein